jgi:hypothetical protein
MNGRILLTELDFKSRQRWLWSGGLLCLLLLLSLLSSTPVFADAHCAGNDQDGDGYYTVEGCGEFPTQLDCDDDNAAINPGAAEICDGIDNNCSGFIDEIVALTGANFGKESAASTTYDCMDGIDNDGDGFVDFADPQCQAAACGFRFPASCEYNLETGLPGQGNTCSVTQSINVCQAGQVVCADPRQFTFGDPPQPVPIVEPEPEMRYTAACHDGIDNDLDGLIDGDDPDCQLQLGQFEMCNGLDDNYDGTIDNNLADGTSVGQACNNSGLGACFAEGVRVCNAAGTGTVCSAFPISPKQEGPFGSSTCSDGIDNNCSGLTDMADPACQLPAEICDGLDNTGDGFIDTPFKDLSFSNAGPLGQSCTVGVNACQRTGAYICSADGGGTVCSVQPGVPSLEGPSGPTCSDGIDNDCDGLIDMDDPDCQSANIAVSCALPYITPPKDAGRGEPGSDCNSWRQVVYQVPPQFANAQITADLLALAPDGTILGSLPVKHGDSTHLKSRIDPGDFKLNTKPGPRGTVVHDVSAPVPMLRVQVKDGLNTATAFCSPIPYLQVMEPSGSVTTEGEVLRVLVALPKVDPTTLSVRLNGVDILSQLGISAAALASGKVGPLSAPININGTIVQVSDFVLDVSGTINPAVPAANMLRMGLSNLDCGGHILAVDSNYLAGALPTPVTAACHVDDMADRGNASVFAVSITNPAPQSIASVPTQVTGQVCHGQPILSIFVNGKRVASGETSTNITPGDGINTADTVKVNFSTQLNQTDLIQELQFRNTPLGTFDAGSNRVIVEANDDQGKRAFKSHIFATGNVALPPQASTLNTPEYQALEQAVHDQVRTVALDQLAAEISASSAVLEVDNAFAVGLSKNAINQLFNSKCKEPDANGKTLGQKFAEAAENSIRAKIFDPIKVPFACSCDPTLRLKVTEVTINPNDVSCNVLFPGETHPDGGTVGNDRFTVAVTLPDVRVTVADTASCRVEDPVFGVCLSKARAEARVTIEARDPRLTFDVTENQLMGSTGPAPSFFVGTEVEVQRVFNTSVGCIGGAICDGFLSLIGIDTTPNINISTVTNFGQEIGAGQPDPIQLEEIKIDEEEIADFEQKVSGALSGVDISANGIIAGLRGSFSTTLIDPEVEETPGALLTSPPLPNFSNLFAAGAQDASVLLNVDTVNLMFASMTQAGKLKTSCVDSTKTVGDILPSDCNAISAASPAATDGAQALCHGIKGSNCESLVGDNLFLTPVKQGICHGLQQATCTQIPTGLAGIVMPADCESIVIPPIGDFSTDGVEALVRGICHGRQGNSCESLTAATDQLTATKQGACHGATQPVVNCQAIPVSATVGLANVEKATCEAVKGTACNTLPLGQPIACGVANATKQAVDALLRTAEQQACEQTPSLGISASDKLLFCSRADVPPTFKLMDNPATSAVETALRLNDLSMAIVVDRDGGGLNGELATTPSCFVAGAPTVGDCALLLSCLDININSSMQIASGDTCGGKPGFQTKINEVQLLNRQSGVVCGGNLPAGDDSTLVDNSATGNESIEVLKQQGEDFSPPICADGLTLGGFVNFQDPKLIAVKTSGNPLFQDFVGLTGQIQAAISSVAASGLGGDVTSGFKIYLPHTQSTGR